VSIHEAKMNLSWLIDAVAEGDVVVIAKAGKRHSKGGRSILLDNILPDSAFHLRGLRAGGARGDFRRAMFTAAARINRRLSTLLRHWDGIAEWL
jgi:hypothetical protein